MTIHHQDDLFAPSNLAASNSTNVTTSVDFLGQSYGSTDTNGRERLIALRNHQLNSGISG